MNSPRFYRWKTQEFRDLLQYVISPFLDCQERYDMKTVNKLFYGIFNKYWRLEFKDSGYYIGEVILRTNENYTKSRFCTSKFIPHGKGKYFRDNFVTYEGDWKYGAPHGRGQVNHVNTEEDYKGEWKDGLE